MVVKIPSIGGVPERRGGFSFPDFGRNLAAKKRRKRKRKDSGHNPALERLRGGQRTEIRGWKSDKPQISPHKGTEITEGFSTSSPAFPKWLEDNFPMVGKAAFIISRHWKNGNAYMRGPLSPTHLLE